MKDKKQFGWGAKLATLGLIALPLGAYAAWALFASEYLTLTEGDPLGKLGQLGDSFGVINAFFSLLMFTAIIVTLLLQGTQLAMQRDELAMQRQEMKESREAMQEQADHSGTQVLIAINQLKSAALKGDIDMLYHEISRSVNDSTSEKYRFRIKEKNKEMLKLATEIEELRDGKKTLDVIREALVDRNEKGLAD